jgi:hypothetical protein
MKTSTCVYRMSIRGGGLSLETLFLILTYCRLSFPFFSLDHLRNRLAQSAVRHLIHHAKVGLLRLVLFCWHHHHCLRTFGKAVPLLNSADCPSVLFRLSFICSYRPLRSQLTLALASPLPRSRTSHAGSSYGCLLTVHSGIYLDQLAQIVNQLQVATQIQAC